MIWKRQNLINCLCEKGCLSFSLTDGVPSLFYSTYNKICLFWYPLYVVREKAKEKLQEVYSFWWDSWSFNFLSSPICFTRNVIYEGLWDCNRMSYYWAVIYFFCMNLVLKKDLQTSRLTETAGSFREQIEGQHCFLLSASHLWPWCIAPEQEEHVVWACLRLRSGWMARKINLSREEWSAV